MALAGVIGFVALAVLLVVIEALFRWRQRRRQIGSILLSDNGSTLPLSTAPSDDSGSSHHDHHHHSGHHGGDHGGMGGHGGFGGGHGH